MNEAAINITDLGFSYRGGNTLFSGLNLQVPAGESFGIFGPNGAGKTSLMSLMTGLLKYEQGKIELFGKKVAPNHKSANKLFGFVPQDFAFYDELTPVENLAFFGAWAGLGAREIKQRTDELLEVMTLTDVRDKQVRTFSGGMKRRVNLAIGIIHHPRIIFLDEPTVGVDVHTRHDIIHYLRTLNEDGTTLVYTSHQLSEAEGLCTSIALIDNGQIIAHDTLDGLLTSHQQQDLEGLFLALTGKVFEDA